MPVLTLTGLRAVTDSVLQLESDRMERPATTYKSVHYHPAGETVDRLPAEPGDLLPGELEEPKVVFRCPVCIYCSSLVCSVW